MPLLTATFTLPRECRRVAASAEVFNRLRKGARNILRSAVLAEKKLPAVAKVAGFDLVHPVGASGEWAPHLHTVLPAVVWIEGQRIRLRWHLSDKRRLRRAWAMVLSAFGFAGNEAVVSFERVRSRRRFLRHT